MDIQITQTELDNLTSRALVPIACKQCTLVYYKPKNRVLANIAINTNNPKMNKFVYCSGNCKRIDNKIITYTQCAQCNKAIVKRTTEVKRTNNSFCNNSCAAKYTNSNKSTGIRRSSYETYIEQQLTAKSITVINNGKIHGYEIDLYLPQYKLAIEINGVTHYKPIYGQAKLDNVQFRDKMKLEMCNNMGINLVMFDVSNFSHFRYNKHHCDTFLNHLLGAYR